MEGEDQAWGLSLDWSRGRLPSTCLLYTSALLWDGEHALLRRKSPPGYHAGEQGDAVPGESVPTADVRIVGDMLRLHHAACVLQLQGAKNRPENTSCPIASFQRKWA